MVGPDLVSGLTADVFGCLLQDVQLPESGDKRSCSQILNGSANQEGGDASADLLVMTH